MVMSSTNAQLRFTNKHTLPLPISHLILSFLPLLLSPSNFPHHFLYINLLILFSQPDKFSNAHNTTSVVCFFFFFLV